MKLFGFLDFSLIDIVDILLVAALIFFVYKWIRHSAAANIFVAIIIIILVRLLADVVNMKMTSAILGALVDIGAVAIVVIFQPEIRQFLSRIGRGSSGQPFVRRLLGRKSQEMDSAVANEIASACKEMSDDKIGALIVLPGKDSLREIVETGDIVDAKVSERLIRNIFFKNSPLHDGAMIISEGRIEAARCTLPITASKIPPKYGMRHKAAVGLSEAYDARVVVVSEQTGKISFIKEGKIEAVDGENSLKLLLQS